jgi:hypothetical protein
LAQGARGLNAQSTLLRAPRYIERSIAVGAILTAIGIAIIATGLIVGDVGGTLLASLGSIFVTVALLSVVYDAYLKDVLIREIYGALGIQQSLQAIDLREIVRRDQVDITGALADADQISALPLDPMTWVLQDWPRLASAARKATLPVTIYLPTHNNPHIEVLARRMGSDPVELGGQIAQLPDELAESWDQKEAGETGSTLQVILYSAVPAVGLLVTQRIMILEVPPSLGYATADRSSLALIFGNKGWSALVEDFVGDQLKPDRIPAFSRSIMRPISGSTSPDASEISRQPRQAMTGEDPHG